MPKKRAKAKAAASPAIEDESSLMDDMSHLPPPPTSFNISGTMNDIVLAMADLDQTISLFGKVSEGFGCSSSGSSSGSGWEDNGLPKKHISDDTKVDD